MAKAGKFLSQAEKDEVLRKQKSLCALCNQPLDIAATHFDLLRPWKEEGEEDIKALQAICASCHAKKTSVDRPKNR